jgi:hypothetical protein
MECISEFESFKACYGDLMFMLSTAVLRCVVVLVDERMNSCIPLKKRYGARTSTEMALKLQFGRFHQDGFPAFLIIKILYQDFASFIFSSSFNSAPLIFYEKF